MSGVSARDKEAAGARDAPAKAHCVGRRTLPLADTLTLLSTRGVSAGISAEVVFMGEDALARSCGALGPISVSASQRVLRKAFHNRFSRTVPPVESLYTTLQHCTQQKLNGSVLTTVLNPDELDLWRFARARGKTILYAIDVWEADVERVYRACSGADLLLLAYGDSVDLLRARVGSCDSPKVELFPNYVDHKYYDFVELPRSHDLIQVGRKDPVLHEWASRYAAERDRSYIYEKRSAKGIWYFDGRPWDLPTAQLSYRALMRVLASSSIALVSPPDRSDSKRTGRVSPLTHRYLEAAMCGAVPVGFPPRGSEYAGQFPSNFTSVASGYESFERLCDLLLSDSDMRRALVLSNRAYVAASHSSIARAGQLRQLLAPYQDV
jgi:hypothetical protein